MHGFFNALVFFTRLPAPRWVAFTPQRQRRVVAYWPLTGWLTGTVAASVWLSGQLVLPAPVAMTLSLAATVGLTGALHEDGFADVCDGLGGGRDCEQALAIMKDPRLGAFGAVGLVLLLALKLGALIGIADRAGSPWLPAAVLLAGHGVSRLLATIPIQVLPYVSGAGARSTPFAGRFDAAGWWLAALGGLPPVLLPAALATDRLVLAVLPSLLGVLWLTRRLRQRLGGYTGDALGAAQQLGETLFYLGVCALLPG